MSANSTYDNDNNNGQNKKCKINQIIISYIKTVSSNFVVSVLLLKTAFAINKTDTYKQNYTKNLFIVHYLQVTDIA